MSTVNYAAFLAMILVFQAYSVTADFNIPFFSPPSGNNNSCMENVCGKGNCVVSNNSTFGYECQCDSGWKQPRSDDDHTLNFLPCVIPNCTLNNNCGNAPAPASASYNRNKSDLPFLDPCFWSYCGGGSCNKTSIVTHTCECEEGYFNLFNSTAFPCYRECALGMNCANLGLGLINSSTSQPDPRPDTTNASQKSRAVSLNPRFEFGWLITMANTLVLVVWKYGLEM